MLGGLKGPTARFILNFTVGSIGYEGVKKVKPYLNQKVDALTRKVFTPNQDVSYPKLPDKRK